MAQRVRTAQGHSPIDIELSDSEGRPIGTIRRAARLDVSIEEGIPTEELQFIGWHVVGTGVRFLSFGEHGLFVEIYRIRREPLQYSYRWDGQTYSGVAKVISISFGSVELDGQGEPIVR